MKQQKTHLFDDPKNVTRLIRLLSAICAMLFALDFILVRHGSHPLDSSPGFYAFYGFVACVLLVIIAKWLRVVLMRPENYYQNEIRKNEIRQKEMQQQENLSNKTSQEPTQHKNGRHDNAAP